MNINVIVFKDKLSETESWVAICTTPMPAKKTYLGATFTGMDLPPPVRGATKEEALSALAASLTAALNEVADTPTVESLEVPTPVP
jgi:hypothetical protein